MIFNIPTNLALISIEFSDLFKLACRLLWKFNLYTKPQTKQMDEYVNYKYYILIILCEMKIYFCWIDQRQIVLQMFPDEQWFNRISIVRKYIEIWKVKLNKLWLKYSLWT